MKDIRDQVNKFLTKFKCDNRKFSEKLMLIGISRATYADFKYGRRIPKKKTLESISAYLEDRAPKYDLIDKSKEFYCCSCEQAKPLDKQHDRWTCNTCKNKQRDKSRKKNWSAFLRKRSVSKLRTKYGQGFGECMRAILDIKKEMKRYE